MLLNNQRITLDFASKTPVKINNIMYKEGEKDRDGIIIEGLNVSIQETDSIVVYWLYSTQDLYIFVPTLGERISETEIKTLPPRGVLQKGEVGVEVIVLGADGSELKSQSGYIPVQASLIQEDYSGDADDDVSITMQLIAQATDLHQAAIALNAQMATAHQGRIDAENLREDKFDVHEANLIQKRDGVASATSVTNTAKDGANTAKANADSKASLANSKATLAQTATTNANNAKTAADASVASANTIKSQLETSTSSANTAKTNADSKASLANTKATLANDKATLANTAATNADNAKNKAAAIPGEIVKARTGMDGVVHANLNERLRKDFEFIGKKLPVSKTSSGSGEVVFDGSLSGEVSGMVVEGQTLVNVVSKTKPTSTSIDYINTPNKYYGMHDFQITTKANTVYTLVFTCKKLVISKGEAVLTVRGYDTGDNFQFIAIGNKYLIQEGLNVLTMIPSSTMKNFLLGLESSPVNAISCDISNVIILEGDHTDKPLSFFEGLKSAELETATSHGVNLVDKSKMIASNSSYTSFGKPFESGGYTFYNFGNKPLYYDFYSVSLGDNTNIRVDPNKSVYHEIPSGRVCNRVRTIIADNVTDEQRSEWAMIAKNLNNTPTTYIPYQSSTTTLPSPITLRSLPNGVADTYDFDTQTLTRRCGEVVLNGSESGWAYLSNSVNFSGSGIACGAGIGLADMVKNGNVHVDKFVNDKLRSVASSSEWSDATATIPCITGNAMPGVSIKTTLALTGADTLDAFKAWLAQNPTTVVYQLAAPTIEIVETSGQLRSYDYQTTIRTDSVIPPKITATAPIDFTTSLATITNDISTVSNNDNAEYFSIEMSNIHDELNAIKAALVITPEA